LATEVIVPKLGLTMEEATIIEWMKKEGDQVGKGDAILEIETDKSTVEVESPASGVMGLPLYPKGSTLPVGQVVTYILAPGESSPSTPPKTPSQLGKIGIKAAEKRELLEGELPSTGNQLMASPVARRVAHELGIDIYRLVGSGPKGRVMESDVRRAALVTEREKAAVTFAEPPITEVHPLESIRRLTAERMVKSFTSAPHFYLSVEIDASLLLKMRESFITPIEQQTGVRPTISDFLIKIAAQTLEEHPEVNVIWEKEGLRRIAEVNVGLATATDRGLIVPIFHQANRKSLAEITKMRQQLVDKARSSSLSLLELEGGSFTISNLGTYAVDQFNAIINPPQAAIMAVGRVKERPVAINGELAIRPTMIISLSVDHRILDGAEAARFLDRIVSLSEAPYLITSLW
jgi:pyruvate dehydrogenase E2 component (dihydrolipoamide acetyltransferase)